MSSKKSVMISARLTKEQASFLDTFGLNTTKILEKGINDLMYDIPKLNEIIEKKEKEIDILKNKREELKKQMKKREEEIKRFFKESKPLLKKNPALIEGRMKFLYNEYKIPTTVGEFYEMMEEYTK